MLKVIVSMVLVGTVMSATAQQVGIDRQPLGSGQPGAVGIENATKWDNNIYHAPQYMPGHPTAATLYPRVIDVPCVQTATGLNCKGYNWLPELGRGEYLMIRPVVTVEQKPTVVTNTTIIREVVQGPVREVLVEVPVKKKKE